MLILMITNVKNVIQLVSIVKVQDLKIVILVLMVTISISDSVLKLVHMDSGLPPIPCHVMKVSIHVLIVMALLGCVVNVKSVLSYMLLMNLLSVLLNVQMVSMNLILLPDNVYHVTNLVELVMEKEILILMNVLFVLLVMIVIPV
jgi:hypothetical protein